VKEAGFLVLKLTSYSEHCPAAMNTFSLAVIKEKKKKLVSKVGSR
jgi:hypothetical protein